jgi:hypothetical protein
MVSALERPCANPACSCRTPDVTCSLWCGALDRPAGVRCVCRHDTCARPLARASTRSAGARPVAATPLTPSARESLPGVRSA